MKNKDYWNFLFEGKTKSELVSYRRKIRDIEFASKNWTTVQRNKEYFWALSEGAHWLLEQLELSYANYSEVQGKQIQEVK